MAVCRLLERQNFASFLKSVDNFLFDCDGVLWHADSPIKGAKETLSALKKLGKRVFLLSNNSSKSRAQYAEKCSRLGFPVSQDDILCTSYAVAYYLHQQKFTGKVYLVGNENMVEEMSAFGIKSTGVGPDPVIGSVAEWRKVQLDPEVKCVVVGFDPHISFMKVLKAASYIKHGGCSFIATNEDPCLPLPQDEHILIPGTGTIVAPVKVAAEQEPLVLGKPSRFYVDMLIQTHGLDVERSVMIGDRLETDIAMANECHMTSLLVLTGHSTISQVRQHEKTSTANLIPTLYTESVADLGTFLQHLQ